MRPNQQGQIHLVGSNNEGDQMGKVGFRPHLTILFLSAITIIGLIAWQTPRALGLYYQTRGGQLIAMVLNMNDNNPAIGITYTQEPLDDETSRDLISQALVYAQKSIQYNPGLAKAHLLSGQAYYLIGEPEMAMIAYQEYTRLKPNNPLGVIELSFAYKKTCGYIEIANHTEVPQQDISLCKNTDFLSDIRNMNKVAGVSTNDYIAAGTQILVNGDFATAMEFFELALIIDPNSWESLVINWYSI